jgi:hypothetical protein
MNDLAIPLSGVDALHAHFAEWVKFLDAKGLELEAQLAKLEAKKVKAGLADTTSSSCVNLAPDGPGFLELAFGEQAKQARLDAPLETTHDEPSTPSKKSSPLETFVDAVDKNAPLDDPSLKTNADPESTDLASAMEAPEFDQTPIPDIPSDEVELA